MCPIEHEGRVQIKLCIETKHESEFTSSTTQNNSFNKVLANLNYYNA